MCKGLTDEAMGKVKIVSDFLPSPKKLALKDETVKTTITKNKRIFLNKKYAKK